MNRFPELCRRLRIFAASQDEKGVRETLAALGRESGWASAVDDFIETLNAREADIVADNLDALDEAAIASGGQGALRDKVGFGIVDATIVNTISGRILLGQIGQSNAEPHAPTANLSAGNASFTAAYPNVMMLSQADNSFIHDPNQWQNFGPTYLQPTPFDLGSGGGVNPSLGFELSMMRDLDTARPGGFAFARVSVGGSNIGEWLQSGLYPSTGQNLFAQMVAYLKAAMVTLDCKWLVLCWNQSESDAKTFPNASAYYGLLGQLVTALRAQLGNIGPGGVPVPFVYGRLNADANPGTYLGLVNMRASQNAFESTLPNLKLVSQDSITQASGQYDGTHYTADGYITLGHLYSPAVAAFCGCHVPPVASFTNAPNSLQVTFTDTSVSYGDRVVSWLWDFGDGATSTAQNPVHTYAGAGTYNVTLTAIDTTGAKNKSAPVAVSVIAGIAGVTRDPLSAWYVPANQTEWTTFLTAIGSSMAAPDSIWLCQEASGSLADSGSAGVPLAVTSGTPGYQQAVSGWSRKGVSMTENTAQGFSSTSASLPDISTTSQLTLLFVKMPSSAPAANRGVLAQGTSAATRSATLLNTAGHVVDESTTTNTAAGTSNMVDGAVHVLLLQTDRTNSHHFTFSELEKLAATFGATMTGKGIYLGSEFGALSAAGITALYMAQWVGANAEAASAALKTLANGLTGLTIPWS